MSKKKIALLCTLLLIFGILLGAGSSYTFRHIGDLKSAAEDLVDKDKAQDTQDTESTENTEQATGEEAPASQEEAEAPEATAKTSVDSPLQTPEDALTTASSKEMDVSEIVEKCLPSVVAITNKGETEIRSMWGNFTQETSSSGSGVIIGQTDSELLILTNYHVIKDSEQLSVVFSWEENQETVDQNNIITAQVKDYDSAKDIAVIAIDMNSLKDVTAEHITVASIGDSSQIKLGQQVVAIGNALGYGQSVTTGIVSALNRSVEAGSDIGSDNKYIQTDAAINPGNSGGALFNMNGELIGINSAKIATDTVEGMGYAIPISTIMENVELMMNSETKTLVDEADRGVLGISCIDVTQEISQSYGMPVGVYISDTTANAGAANAGLKKGDIITAINKKSVSDTTSLKRYLAYYKAGETVTITVARQAEGGYNTTDVPVTLSPASVNATGNEPADNGQNKDQNNNQGNSEDPSQGSDEGTQYVNPYDQLFDLFQNFGFGGSGH